MRAGFLKGTRGYFFLIDAFLAMSVIAFGLLMAFSFRSYRPQEVQPFVLADDVMESLSSNRVEDLANNASLAGFYVKKLIDDGSVTDTKNTLLEQAAEFFVEQEAGLARDFVVNITSMLVPSQYGFMVLIAVNSSTEAGMEILVNNISVQPEESTMLVASKRIVAGAINESIMWGPLVMEARVWR